MKKYNLLQTANQTFSTTLNGHVFDLWFRLFRGNLYCSCYIDNELAEAGYKAIINKPIFSNAVSNVAGGNFRFYSQTVDEVSIDKLNGYDIAFVFE